MEDRRGRAAPAPPVVVKARNIRGVMREFSDVLARKREGFAQIYLGYAAGVGKTCAISPSA